MSFGNMLSMDGDTDAAVDRRLEHEMDGISFGNQCLCVCLPIRTLPF